MSLEVPVKIQERIRRARRRAGLSQAGLAALVNVRRSAVSNWESTSNEVMPSMQSLLAVAKAIDAELPVILVTGDTSAERLRQASASGHVLLHKPVSPLALQAAMAQALAVPAREG